MFFYAQLIFPSKKNSFAFSEQQLVLKLNHSFVMESNLHEVKAANILYITIIITMLI